MNDRVDVKRDHGFAFKKISGNRTQRHFIGKRFIELTSDLMLW